MKKLSALFWFVVIIAVTLLVTVIVMDYLHAQSVPSNGGSDPRLVTQLKTYDFTIPLNWPNDSTKFLRGDRTWATVGGSTVTSVFTRTGAVVATTGDYTVGQVTGAAPSASPVFTGVILSPVNTAVAPTYSFSAHTGDGLFWSGTLPTGDTGLAIAVGGSRQFGFGSSGSLYLSSVIDNGSGVVNVENDWTFNAAANTLAPNADATGDLGTTALRPRDVFVSRALRTGTAGNTDLAGKLTNVAGTVSRTFTGTYTSAPVCVASDTATTVVSPQVTTTTTTLTLTVAGGVNTDTFNYICIPRN